MTRTALIAGATGASAKRLVEVLLDDPQWSLIGLSRHPPAERPSPRLTFIGADLADAVQSTRALARCTGITHVFYTARATHGESGHESVEDNVAMLRNLLDAMLPVAHKLEHVHLVEGGKYYGVHLGPYPTPAVEDDPRPASPNFYYDQEDLLRDRQRGQRWTWSASRPNVICDFASERPRNLVPVIGAYAAILRELGMPLHFPGKPGCWQALTEVTDATHFARSMAFMATDPRARNQAFNVSNGDLFRWQRLWPRIAQHFGLAVGDVRPCVLTEWVRDKDSVWQAVVRRHRLAPSNVGSIAAWGFGDFLLRQDYDVVSSTTKLRQAGFHDVVDTGQMFVDHLTRYRDAGILP